MSPAANGFIVDVLVMWSLLNLLLSRCYAGLGIAENHRPFVQFFVSAAGLTQ
jgi:hypothetical protein